MTPSNRRLALALLAALCITAALLTLDAGAAGTGFPGRNGRIVFNDRSGNLVLVNPDGTGRRTVRAARSG